MLSSLQVKRKFHISQIEQLILYVDPVGYGALALYIYAVGAPFEATLNNYMITSQAIYPLGIRPGSNGNLTRITTNGSLELVTALRNK